MNVAPAATQSLHNYLEANTGMISLTISGGINPLDGKLVTTLYV